MTIATLFIVFPEHSECERIAASLSSHYLSWTFCDLDSALLELNEQPNLILCCQSLLEAQQAEKISNIKLKSPQSKLLIMGPEKPMEREILALKNGARGYFDYSLPIEKLNDALRVILKGEVWVKRHVISGFMDALTHVPVITEKQKQALETLSLKEIEVAEQVSYGVTNKMVARNMNITERTVKSHLTSIFHKLNIHDRLSLAIFFRDLR